MPPATDIGAAPGQGQEREPDVSDQLDVCDEVVVDLGRRGVDAENPLVTSRVPVLGRVLNQVVANRQHEVGVGEPGHLVVARLEPDSAEGTRIV